MCEIELQEFSSLKKFDDVFFFLTFYHVERCEQEDFTINLRYLYVEHCFQKIGSIEPLKNYCRMRKLQFMCACLFIHRLADLEKKTNST